MSSYSNSDVIHVSNLNLWAHVGVLEKERTNGQSFILDYSIWLNVEDVSKQDQLSLTVDYSVAIKRIQKFSSRCYSQTLEHFSEQILGILEELYGHSPMRLKLQKCSPPINGFEGSVSIEKLRNFK